MDYIRVKIMTFSEIIKYTENNISNKRFIHSRNVADTAVWLAEKYGADTEKAHFSGLVHDLAKEIDFHDAREMLFSFGEEKILKKYSEPLIHGPLASCILKHKFKIYDDEILDAVWYHTTGKENMSLLTKIIYLADFIEPGRKFNEVEEVRIIAENNLDEAIIETAGIVINHTIKLKKEIHPDTVYARNYLLKQV